MSDSYKNPFKDHSKSMVLLIKNACFSKQKGHYSNAKRHNLPINMLPEAQNTFLCSSIKLIPETGPYIS